MLTRYLLALYRRYIFTILLSSDDKSEVKNGIISVDGFRKTSVKGGGSVEIFTIGSHSFLRKMSLVIEDEIPIEKLVLSLDLNNTRSESYASIRSESVLSTDGSEVEYATENESNYDGIVLIATNDDPLNNVHEDYAKHIQDFRSHDLQAHQHVSFILLPDNFPIRRLVYSPVGELTRDFDDVRRFRDASYNSVKRAFATGASKLLIRLPYTTSLQKSKLYALADLVTMLGALEPLYVPIEVSEAEEKLDMRSITFGGVCEMQSLARAIEDGRILARNIGGSDPQRMTPAIVAEHVQTTFKGTCIKIDVVSDTEKIRKEFPCLAAVDRGSSPSHKARVIFLSYEPEEPKLVQKTIVLVGKGVTYDTGGHDLKISGNMKGMHRDKCGAAFIAGFMKVVSQLKPKDIRILGAMAMVRNSIGPDAYVSDEIIRARSGLRVRIVNTDAEGRMAMVDVLCYMKEKVLKNNYDNVQLFTIATLTGHARIAVGYNYSIIMSNGPAEEQGIPRLIANAGMQIGDPFEISTIRREDYEVNKGRSCYEDINQCHLGPSALFPRGHQIPAAFLIEASGLIKHGLNSDHELCYSHIDIAKTSPIFDNVPSGSPIPAFTRAFLMGEDAALPKYH